jgi:flagellar motor switch protein FliG
MREELTGLRKAAIVMLSLGQRRAAAVLRRLPPDEARMVRQEMRRVGALRRVALRTRQLVLGQFCAAASPNPPLPEPPQSVEDAERQATSEPHPTDGPFSSFQNATPQDLLNMVRDEHPQTIALVLAHLPADRASSVLAGFDRHKRLEIVKRIVGIEQTSSQVIEQVENSLRQRLHAIMGLTVRAGGVSAVAEILNSSVDEQLEDEVLAGLDADVPELAEQIRRVAGVFENLMRAPDEAIAAVIEQLDHATISLALRTAREELKRKVMWNLPQEQAERIEAELSSMEPVAVRDIEQAQQRVAEVVHRLESAGEIDLADGRRRRRRRAGGSGIGIAWRQQHRKAV